VIGGQERDEEQTGGVQEATDDPAVEPRVTVMVLQSNGYDVIK
jgi:hypothetical protein